MIKKVYYIECTNENNEIIENIINDFICFVETEPIEMNYLEVEIVCRKEDISSIENRLKDIIWARKLALR